MAAETDTVTLALDDDNKVVVHLFGATVISWICEGKERLFVSSKAVYDNKKAIRGGIPVVFPNFGPWEHGPQHGFARISKWTLKEKEVLPERASACFELCNNEFTEAMWNHKFRLFYNVRIANKNILRCSLNVTNEDSSEFDFTALLHTYLKVDDVEKAVVSNLTGLKYNDKLRNGEEFTEERELVTVVNGADSVYKGTPDVHVVSGGVDGSKVTVSKENLPDTVLWNPWVENAKNMSDFNDDGYKRMICVEPGYVSQRIIIQPGEVKHFTQHLTVSE